MRIGKAGYTMNAEPAGITVGIKRFIKRRGISIPTLILYPEQIRMPVKDKCLKGLHDLTDSNVWIRPTDGRRYCKECQKDSRRSWYNSLDKNTGKPFCENQLHAMVVENIRGRYKYRQCLQCLEDSDELYDSELGAPLLNSNGDRFKWGVLTEINFW